MLLKTYLAARKAAHCTEKLKVSKGTETLWYGYKGSHTCLFFVVHIHHNHDGLPPLSFRILRGVNIIYIKRCEYHIY